MPVRDFDVRYAPGEVPDAAGERVGAEDVADLVRVEMVAVADAEREIGRCDRRLMCRGEAGVEEEAVGMRRHVRAEPPCLRAGGEGGLGVEVDLAGEGVEVGGRIVGPAVEGDAGLVGGVGGRHPFGFGDAEGVEQRLQLRRAAFADADDADVGGFDDGDGGARPCPGEQACGHPAGRAAA